MTENEKKSIYGLNFLKEKLYNGIYADRLDCIDMAISALKEIQLYKDNKLCLVPTDVYSRQCSELDAYKEIGTVEKCREAMEKQKPKKPHRNYKKFSGLWCKCGWYLGQKQCLDIKYCPNCGQAIDENLEGMEDVQKNN